jgi:periplasmic divalent cation tolerance protein
MKSDLLLVLVTCSSPQEAKRIVQSLLKERLIACANIIPGAESVFLWKDKITSARETLIMMKTKSVKFRAVEKAVKSSHSYEVPEIIAIPVTASSADYLKWVRENVR